MNNAEEWPLGPLTDLVGSWRSTGRGFNVLALPFADTADRYRLLVNRYDETLEVRLVDPSVPNRGIAPDGEGASADQSVATLGYEQTVVQKVAGDFPASALAGEPDTAIHFEPGLWLYMKDQTPEGVDIARLATVPHGDSVLALGSAAHEPSVDIPVIDGLPVGGPTDIEHPYLSPYAHFHREPFCRTADFPGFDPVHPEQLLRFANADGSVSNVTRLTVDTELASAGIRNIPFIVRQADATSMVSTFWTYEFEQDGRRERRLQYLQVVMLDFFQAADGGLIRWPHVSINTLTRSADS